MRKKIKGYGQIRKRKGKLEVKVRRKECIQEKEGEMKT